MPHIRLAGWSHRWILVASLSLIMMGLLLVAIEAYSGLRWLAPVLLALGAVTSLCLRFRLESTDDETRVHNALRSIRLDARSVRSVQCKERPNIGLTTLAFYWSLRRRVWWIVLDDGTRVRAAIFTDVRREGTWRPIGDQSAEQWLATIADRIPGAPGPGEGG